jgi:hypothetical protein
MKFKEETLLNKTAIVAFWILVAIFVGPVILAITAIILGVILAILAIAFVIGLALLPFALIWFLTK